MCTYVYVHIVSTYLPTYSHGTHARILTVLGAHKGPSGKDKYMLVYVYYICIGTYLFSIFPPISFSVGSCLFHSCLLYQKQVFVCVHHSYIVYFSASSVHDQAIHVFLMYFASQWQRMFVRHFSSSALQFHVSSCPAVQLSSVPAFHAGLTVQLSFFSTVNTVYVNVQLSNCPVFLLSMQP